MASTKKLVAKLAAESGFQVDEAVLQFPLLEEGLASFSFFNRSTFDIYSIYSIYSMIL